MTLLCAAPPAEEIVQMARDAGARKVYLASAAPPVRYPNVYGIDMPTPDELVAHDRSVEEIRAHHRLRCPDLPRRSCHARSGSARRFGGLSDGAMVLMPRVLTACTSPATSRWQDIASTRTNNVSAHEEDSTGQLSLGFTQPTPKLDLAMSATRLCPITCTLKPWRCALAV
jgi:hypothetical protein